MREIKFRAWNTIKERYHYNVQDTYDSYIADSFKTFLDNEDLVVEQYTGIKDKNGVEIYENDIVKNSGSNIYVVEFFDGRFNPISELEGSQWEVIGNIHDQPELLEEQS